MTEAVNDRPVGDNPISIDQLILSEQKKETEIRGLLPH